MRKKIYAVVVAGGSGTRMGGPVPKQFLTLGGKPVLQRSIERIRAAWPEALIVTVLPSDSIDYWRSYSLEHIPSFPQMLVEGGITRFHSVRNALARIPEGTIVAIHDAVRPLVSVDLLKRLISEMESERAVVPVVPVSDTLKAAFRDGDGEIRPLNESAPDRSRVFAAQTPQLFLSEDLKAAYAKPFDTAFTDDCSVAVAAGIPVSFIEGEKYNIKLTTPDDMSVAAALLSP